MKRKEGYFTIARPKSKAATRNTTNKIMAIKNSILATPAVAAEMPVKPNKPAIRETIKKKSASLSISYDPNKREK